MGRAKQLWLTTPLAMKSPGAGRDVVETHRARVARCSSRGSWRRTSGPSPATVRLRVIAGSVRWKKRRRSRRPPRMRTLATPVCVSGLLDVIGTRSARRHARDPVEDVAVRCWRSAARRTARRPRRRRSRQGTPCASRRWATAARRSARSMLARRSRSGGSPAPLDGRRRRSRSRRESRSACVATPWRSLGPRALSASPSASARRNRCERRSVRRRPRVRVRAEVPVATDHARRGSRACSRRTDRGPAAKRPVPSSSLLYRQVRPPVGSLPRAA